MIIHLIRHAMTEANEKKLYCGQTDLSISKNGHNQLLNLKAVIPYPKAELYFVSGLLRTVETLQLLYPEAEYTVVPELKEFHFGDFEMKSYHELKENEHYLRWIGNIENEPCLHGECQIDFKVRIMQGLQKILELNPSSAVVVTHGGVIAQVMESLFPNERNFYEWQPDHVRGYTVTINETKSYQKI